MKIIKLLLCLLLTVAALALLLYEYNTQGNLASTSIVKAGAIILGAILAVLRPTKRTVINKKALYEKAYAEYIQNVFYEEPRLEKRFYSAVEDYNQNKPSAALRKLEKLRPQCQRTADLRAVTIFTALCLDEMQLYSEAIIQYDAALHIRSNSTLYSNKGLCLQRIGQYQAAKASYLLAIQVDPKNAYAHNNLASLYFRQGLYADSLAAAQEAIAIDEKMPQANSTAAMCSYLLGNCADYERYYRQAVANGYDGQKIKAVLRALNPDI